MLRESDAELIQDRVELMDDHTHIRLRTHGGYVDKDIERLREIITTVNSEFETLHKAALRSQELIEEFLEENLLEG